MIYHPKHKIAYYLKHIKFKRHIILAIGFLIADPLLVNLLCRAIDAAIPSELDYLSGINLTKDRYCFVPTQDFTQEWTDNKLYEKYSLTAEEIEFIESMIKPMQ